MSLENEICDMKMNDDDNIASYFVRISFKEGTGKCSTQWSSQDMGCICRKHEHKEVVLYILRTLDLLCTRRIKD